MIPNSFAQDLWVRSGICSLLERWMLTNSHFATAHSFKLFNYKGTIWSSLCLDLCIENSLHDILSKTYPDSESNALVDYCSRTQEPYLEIQYTRALHARCRIPPLCLSPENANSASANYGSHCRSWNTDQNRNPMQRQHSQREDGSRIPIPQEGCHGSRGMMPINLERMLGWTPDCESHTAWWVIR